MRAKEKSFFLAQLNDRPDGDMLPGEVCHDRKSASVPTGEIRLENSKAGTAFGKNGKCINGSLHALFQKKVTAVTSVTGKAIYSKITVTAVTSVNRKYSKTVF